MSAGPDPRADAILAIVLGDHDIGSHRLALLHDERVQAVSDLIAAASFAPLGLSGPFRLHLGVQQGRLVLDVRDANDGELRVFLFALSPFRRLIKDYGLLVESYEHAIRDGRGHAIQAIDMGRRGLHDEGARLMIERLAGKVAIDFETARRLFTLLCVLQQRT